MRFSIIVPIYNVERYLQDCLDSLASQTFDDYEIVLVNDGSTDGSSRLLNEFVRSTPVPTKLIEKDNQGLYLARNTGLKNAEGDYVLMIDSDDTLAPYALATIAAQLDETPVDIVLFESSLSPDYTNPVEVHLENGKVYTDTEVREHLLKGVVRNALFTKAFKRELVPPVEYEDAYLGFCLAEDLAYSMRMFDRCESAVFIDMPLYYYRSNDASISRTAPLKQLSDIDRMANMLVQYCNEWSTSNGDWVKEQALVKCCYLAFNYAETLCMTGSNAQIAEGLDRLRKTRCFSHLLNEFDFETLDRREMRKCLSLIRSEKDGSVAVSILPKRLNSLRKRFGTMAKNRLSQQARS